ncbi:MAG: spore germination protein [Bacilli bacterium]|nr:spore germination protein [Acholeplasmataceae bacterium]
MTNLSLDYQQNADQINDLLGIDYSFDIDTRDFLIQGHRIRLYFLTFMIDGALLTEVIDGLLKFEINTSNNQNTFFNSLLANISYHAVGVTKEIDSVVNSVLNGLVAIIVENSDEAITLDIRKYPGRSIAEPDSEKVVRGSRDGFTENFAINIALVRRRIRTGKLRMEYHQVGKVSKTDLCLTYIDGYVDQKIIDYVKLRLKQIDTDEITMSDKALEELLLESNFSPYPLVRYTERPDTLSVHLYQGMFAIIVDTSPSVILGPVSIFDHMQHAEEYRQTPLAGTYLRILRFIGIFASFLLIPLWFALLSSRDIIPAFFRGLFEIGDDTRTEVFFQIILAEVGIEFLRMASIHTPNSLSTAMGLVAGVIIGEIAITVGLFTEIIVLLGSISAIGSYITPSYELSLANKISKLLLLIGILFFDIWGLIGGLILLFIYLASLKSFTRPYLYPLVPFKLGKLVRQVIRFPYTMRPFSKNKKKN